MGRVSRRYPPRLRNAGLVACFVASALVATSAELLAQSSVRRLTTIAALQQYPRYYHLQNVLLRGEFVEHQTRLMLQSDASRLALVNPSMVKKGPVEVRGQFIDVGRLEPDDPRIGEYVKRRGSEAWPAPGTELVLNLTGVFETDPITAPTVRSLSLEPWRFEGQKVTIVGNFRGRNLLGDLPDAPGKGKYDFVLAGNEGAIWVVGLRPRGRGFDLDVDRRVDTNRWLRVTGVVNRQKGLVTLEGAEVALTEPEKPVKAAEPDPQSNLPPPEPVVVVFSAPTPDETDVPSNVAVRIQLSRGLRESSLNGRIRVTYAGGPSTEPPIQFKTTYDPALRAIQLAFSKPLTPFQTVKVELLEGLTAFDGAPVVSWSLTFTVGSR